VVLDRYLAAAVPAGRGARGSAIDGEAVLARARA
jgi:hypothetical protein